MQTALDDVAPEGLDSGQAQSVAVRIEALVAPRVKRRGFLSLFKRLFRARPPAEARVARRGAPAAAPPAPAPAVAAPGLDEGGGLEDMAPIAPTVEAPRPLEGRAEAPSRRQARQGIRRVWLLGLGLGLLLVAGALFLAQRRRAAPSPARPVPPPAAGPAAPPPRLSPAPTPAPRVAIRRESALGTSGNGPLPAALPPTTPQSASQLQ